MGKYLVILTAIIVIGVVALFGREYFSPAGTTDMSPEEREQTLAENNKVAVTHAFKDGVHRYTGTFLLPHSCFSVNQSGVYQNDTITMSFRVEDRLATEKTCVKITTRYPFTILVEAPEGTPAIFYLNEEEVPSKIRDLEWQSAVGNLIDTSVTSPTFR